MNRLGNLRRNDSGTAAAEMALVLPLLLIIMMGSMELGNYFYNEHILVKSVRDGARFAARQSFTDYSCSGTPGGTIEAETRNVVMTGLLTGGVNRLADWQTAEVTLSTTCSTAAGGTPLSGIYRGRTTGAPIVTVTAQMNYVPVLGSFGFTGVGFNLVATQQAAVMGI